MGGLFLMFLARNHGLVVVFFARKSGFFVVFFAPVIDGRLGCGYGIGAEARVVSAWFLMTAYGGGLATSSAS